MTVHKSQGSELAQVLPDQDSPVLTRELLYNGVSRAREAATIFASRERITRAARARVNRSSALFDGLWGASG